MTEFFGNDHLPGDHAVLLAEICRVAMDAREPAALSSQVCALLAKAFGPDAVSCLETAAPPPPAISVNVPHTDQVLVLAGSPHQGRKDAAFVEAVASLLGSALERIRFEHELADGEQRMLLAQRVARMGSYDWDVATDTNRWSDELFRIYGCEPQSFNASYERFLSFVHPDDRERIVAAHRHAFETGEPYQTEERIVRPDGEVRILATNGEVVFDEHGRAARMVGVCMDVTEQRRAEEAAKNDNDRFRALIESAPDAVMVVDQEGAIVHANRQAEVLLGYGIDELSAMQVEDLLASGSRNRHAAHRESFLSDPQPRPMGTMLDISALRKDGSQIYLDVALGVIRTERGVLVAAFARDATPRREAEAAKRRLGEVEQRRRQALEINDNVVQGLVSALTAIESGRFDLGSEAVERTLRSARAMMNDLLGDDRDLVAGDLVREEAAEPTLTIVPSESTPFAIPESGGAALVRNVVIADDSEDLRFLLRMLLARADDFDVVADACDGAAAIQAVRDHAPDVVLVDLAMPRMDGLEAVAAIREASPTTVIVVLSGFDSARMSDAATSAGADAYIEKDASLTDIADVLRQICDRGPAVRFGSYTP